MTLANLGLVLFLGHGGDPCPGVQPNDLVNQWEDVEEEEVLGEDIGTDEEEPAAEEEEEEEENLNMGRTDTTMLTLVHKGGIVSQPVRWCNCQGGLEHHLQLLHLGLYPATQKQPKTAFTLDVLNYFHIDSMVCNTAASSFFAKLRRLTANANRGKVQVSDVLPQECCALISYCRTGTES